MEHLIINLLLVWLCIGLYLGNKKIEKQIQTDKPTTADYIYKLHLILGVSEYDVFKIAAKEKGHAEYLVNEHFARYIQDGIIPRYVEEFIQDGREQIRNCRINTWCW